MNGLAENQETLVISDENPLSEYEQQRLNRIEENNKTLLKLVSFSMSAIANFFLIIGFLGTDFRTKRRVR